MDAEQEITEVHVYAQIQQQREILLSKGLTQLDSAPHTPNLEVKVYEMERYRRRSNLRLYGLAKHEGEDIKQKVVGICAAVLPDEKGKFAAEIDVVHHVGRRLDVNQRPRAVILLFRSRHIRDLLWKSAKKSSFLKEKKLRFAEDLTAVDKETRNQLWPSVEAARKEGRRAYFVGTRAFLDGKEIFVK